MKSRAHRRAADAWGSPAQQKAPDQLLGAGAVALGFAAPAKNASYAAVKFPQAPAGRSAVAQGRAPGLILRTSGRGRGPAHHGWVDRTRRAMTVLPSSTITSFERTNTHTRRPIRRADTEYWLLRRMVLACRGGFNLLSQQRVVRTSVPVRQRLLLGFSNRGGGC